MQDEMVTQAEVEDRIEKVLVKLEEAVDKNFEFSEREAIAESAWKMHLSLVAVRLADGGEKAAKDIREARAMTESNTEGTLGSDLYRTWLINKAAAEATARAQRAHESMLTGLQTVMKSILAAS